ncbi:MAG: MarR family transcriptional regulator [Chloroflexi bacterium]|nr:MarR family transcriptional regulator [Chloroflexota bacterium]
MSSPAQLTDALREWASLFMRRSMHDFMRSMKDTGLSMGQLSTLIRLHYHGPCGVSEVGGHLGVSNAAASQLVERMVQLGLLARGEDPDDRRVKQVSLTEAGRALIQRGVEAHTRWMQDLTAALNPEQQPQIVAALTLLTEVARRLEASEEREA